MDQIKGGVSPMKLKGQVLWGIVGRDGVLVLLTLGSSVRSCLIEQVFVFVSVWAFYVIFEYVLSSSLCFSFPPFCPYWWMVVVCHDGA